MKKYQVVIVTGASSGIGASIAKRLCRNGSIVYGVARDLNALQEVRDSLESNLQKQFIPTACDITDINQVTNVFAGIFRAHDVDLLINNAGIGFSKSIVDYTDKEIDQVIMTNLRGTISTIRAALKNRKTSKKLQIVNTTSLAGKIGFPQLSVYTATKFAIEGLTESLRIEYADKQVSFTILRPGITDTAFFSKAGMELYKNDVKDLKSYYSPDQVSAIFLKKLRHDSKAIIVGNDKLFLFLMPFIPFDKRFAVLDIINKL